MDMVRRVTGYFDSSASTKASASGASGSGMGGGDIMTKAKAKDKITVAKTSDDVIDLFDAYLKTVPESAQDVAAVEAWRDIKKYTYVDRTGRDGDRGMGGYLKEVLPLLDKVEKRKGIRCTIL